MVCGDVLEFWKLDSLFEEDYKIVANLPYYVATKIILKALNDNRCKSITVMIQKEVADKFLAEVEEKEFSSLSVIAQSVGDIKKVVNVSPASFEPQPKVFSSVIQFRKNGNLLSKQFTKFLQIVFKQPRKTLLKNLSQQYDKDRVKTLFKEIGLNFSIRPHQVDIIHYHQIYNVLEDLEIGRKRGVKETSK